MLDLSQKGFTTLHWITLLLQNRVFTLKNDIIKAGKWYLVEHFSLPVHAYDVIKDIAPMTPILPMRRVF